MRYYAGECDGARQAWKKSLAVEETPWAMRNLAVLSVEEHRREEAAGQYVAACRMGPSCLPLAIECGTVLLDSGRAGEWLELLPEFPGSVRSTGRIRLLEARAALVLGDLDRVQSLFDQGLVIEDLREGERSLSDLWFTYHEQRISIQEKVSIDDALRDRVRREFPVPGEFDFRMASDRPAPGNAGSENEP
jgi:hypothetical protein